MLRLKSKRVSLLVFILMSIVVLTACSSEVGSQDGEAAEEAKWTIVITTPDGKDVDFSNLDIEKIGTIKMNATTKKKDGTEEENQWTGVQLNKILDFVGIKEFNLVEVEAGDGFAVEYTKEIATSEKTILAIEKDGEALDEKSGPAQMVVEGEASKLWIKNVAKIKVSN